MLSRRCCDLMLRTQDSITRARLPRGGGIISGAIQGAFCMAQVKEGWFLGVGGFGPLGPPRPLSRTFAQNLMDVFSGSLAPITAHSKCSCGNPLVVSTREHDSLMDGESPNPQCHPLDAACAAAKQKSMGATCLYTSEWVSAHSMPQVLHRCKSQWVLHPSSSPWALLCSDDATQSLMG